MNCFDLPESTRAYIAGLFDGEGSVAIYRENSRLKYNSFLYMATITNTNREVLDYVQHLLGGSITTEDRTPIKNKTCHRWVLKSDKACEFFHMVHEFSIIKKRELEIAMYFWSLPVVPGRPYTVEEVRQRELLIEVLKMEKRR